MRLLGRESWRTAGWYFFEGMAAIIIFCVDFNTVQVEYTVQLHGFVFEDCRKSHFTSIPDAVLRSLRYSSTVSPLMDCRKTHFNSIPDAVLCLETLTGKTVTLYWLIDQSVCVPCCLARPNCDRTQSLSNCVLSPFCGARIVARSALCCCPQSHANDVWFELFLWRASLSSTAHLLRSMRKQRGILVFCNHLWCGDSSPTRLLIPVLWYNIWLILSASVACTCLCYTSLRRT